MALIMAPIMYFTGYYEKPLNGVQPPLVQSLMAGLFGIIVFFVINLRLLLNRGQTVGKMALGIRIVDMGRRPITLHNIAVRYAVYFLPDQIPLIGQLFSLVNILFIFGKSRRCVHDLAAKTQVITARATS